MALKTTRADITALKGRSSRIERRIDAMRSELNEALANFEGATAPRALAGAAF